MDSTPTPNDSDSFWSHLEPLDEFEKIASDLEEFSIPDDAYRQIKSLHLALVEKAHQLTQAEHELERQKQELELVRRDLVSLRLQKSQETAAVRLERLVNVDRKRNTDDALDTDSPNHEQVSATRVDSEVLDSHSAEVEDSASEHEISRFQKSAQMLREKSEIISAVFVELDQMVRDLNRQQELMEDLRVDQSSNSADELNRVTHKLKKRFRRLSRQINLQ